MKIIIPMAGMGTRMRPHTLTIPKPLIVLAGKSIVQRLVEGISKVCAEPIDEIGFVIGNFGEKVEKSLVKIAASVGANAKIYYQEQALGTAHAVWCAAESLSGKTVVAFADTLFFADFKIDENTDSIIWVQKVKNPQSYGVVTTDPSGLISGFVEKPAEFVSDLAIIGIYYFKEGEKLKKELNYIIDNKIIKSGEFQLTTALENLRNKGLKFLPGEVEEWLDCGNKDITVNTHKRILAKVPEASYLSKSSEIKDSTIIQPCFIGNDVKISNSVIGPFVSVGEKSIISNSIIKNTIIQNQTEIDSICVHNSIIGSNTKISGKPFDVSIGDYNIIEM
ncbi:MAG TPA: sugar phosphate nucleotidyltransferase [Bacteroidales bacterium]|nr:sugar phosphate nucleotidyltransferase [Bacteroidales bacterium]